MGKYMKSMLGHSDAAAVTQTVTSLTQNLKHKSEQTKKEECITMYRAVFITEMEDAVNNIPSDIVEDKFEYKS